MSYRIMINLVEGHFLKKKVKLSQYLWKYLAVDQSEGTELKTE